MVHVLVKAVEEVRCQGRDIVPPVPQGRYFNREYIDSIIKIVPEISISHHAFKVLVGGRHQAYINFLDSGIADGLELTFFDEAQ